MQKRLALEHVVCMGLCCRAKACRTLGVSRSTAYYRSEKAPARLAQEALVTEVSKEHPAFGYRKVTAILRTKHAERINPKRVARLRRRDDLFASRRPGKRRRITPGSAERRTATRPDEVWSYDFISDVTTDGVSLRILSIIDEYTRECVLLRAARSFPAVRVIDCLEELLVCTGRKPCFIRSDNGSEFIAKSVRKWLETAQIGACYIDPGSPWQNGHVESFHASFRAEFLDRELFFSVREANAMIEDWRHHYNYDRPHGSLGWFPPLATRERKLPLRATPSAPVYASKINPKQ